MNTVNIEQIQKNREELLQEVVSENFNGLTDLFFSEDELNYRSIIKLWNEEKNKPKVQRMPWIKRAGWWDRRY